MKGYFWHAPEANRLGYLKLVIFNLELSTAGKINYTFIISLNISHNHPFITVAVLLYLTFLIQKFDVHVFQNNLSYLS